MLAVFGGAGGQHACAIARSLGMSAILWHRHAGILSAFGLALADTVTESQVPSAKIYCEGVFIDKECCVVNLFLSYSMIRILVLRLGSKSRSSRHGY